MENNPKKGAAQKAGAGIRPASSQMSGKIGMDTAIKLNFINQSNDTNNSEVAIFQKNLADPNSQTAVAWLVIQNCGQGDNHPFEYPLDMYVGASDSFGNYTPQFPAQPGQAFQMVRTTSGDQLTAEGTASSAAEVDVKNNLPQGSISAWIYKSGKALAVKTNLVPGQMAAFAFEPVIYIGVFSEVGEGQIMDAAMLDVVNTQISLLGISSADIVMTGGGAGPDAQPFMFTLQNVVMA